MKATKCLLGLLLLITAAQAENEPGRKTQEITVRGHIVCLDESEKPLSSCNESSTRFALRGSDGELYKFSPTDPKAEMFVDPRVRQRDLQVSGWLREGYLELIHIHSLKNGKLYHLYYRCEVCNITAYAPGACWCCREEFEFRETPLEEPPVSH